MKKIIISVIALIAVIGACVFGMAACNDDKVLIGFDTDVAQAVCDKLDIKADFQEIEWETKETELNGKSIDCIWNGMTIDADRMAAMTFSQSYLRNKQAYVCRIEDKDTILTADSKRYIAESGSAGAKYLQAKSIALTEAAAQKDILTELMAKTSDLGVMDSIMANYYVNQTTSSYYGKLAVLDVADAEEETYGIGFRKGDIYTAYMINKTLYELQVSGKIAEIAAKYGLTSELVAFTAPVEPTGADKSGWEYIKNNGKLVIGYTLFAPIAYYAE